MRGGGARARVRNGRGNPGSSVVKFAHVHHQAHWGGGDPSLRTGVEVCGPGSRCAPGVEVCDPSSPKSTVCPRGVPWPGRGRHAVPNVERQ